MSFKIVFGLLLNDTGLISVAPKAVPDLQVHVPFSGLLGICGIIIRSVSHDRSASPLDIYAFWILTANP